MNNLNILLADDDLDDCHFFKDALTSLALNSHLITVHNGEELMSHLFTDNVTLPHVLFLDLNMPRKNGFECLAEIKSDADLKLLPVIVFSTSFDQERVKLLYDSGAKYFMRKPAAFSQLKAVIHDALQHIARDMDIENSAARMQTSESNFVITGGQNLVL
ncbi:MAG TPA: response regulator [Chitinophagales bacterium]|nr:response regulator [Chitinophagales bacterium]